jgi:hypothetical protein
MTKKPSALLLALSAALTLPLLAAEPTPEQKANRMPSFSWDRVPQYMHIRKAKKFTADEIKYLASFPLVTFEKTTGFQTFQSSEDGTLAAAKAVKEVNPSTKILYYRNVIVHYGTYKGNTEIEKMPGAFLVGKDGKTKLIRNRSRQEAYDLTNPEVRAWWVGNAKQVCAEPVIDGLFLDGIVKTLTPSYLKRDIGVQKVDELVAGYNAMMDETREALGPDQLMVANVLRVSLPDSGLVALKKFDGSYIEHFEGSWGDKEARRNSLAKAIEAFQKAAREGYLIALTVGLSELDGGDGKSNPGQLDEIRVGMDEKANFSKRFNYLLALFLICAEKHSYFMPHDGYGAEKSKVWMTRPPELERPLGAPKGPAVMDGYIYTREFAHANVRVDIENQVGDIKWLEPGKN